MARRFEHLDEDQLYVELGKANFVIRTYEEITRQARVDQDALIREIDLREND